jgi:hypothetical protein
MPPYQRKKYADQHARPIPQRVRHRARNHPAKSQIHKCFADAEWNRRQQPKRHELRVTGQRHEGMVPGPGERHNGDRHARTPTKHLEAGDQRAVVSHLLGQPPHAWPHQHTRDSGRQGEGSKEVRLREGPGHKPTGRIGTPENEREAHRDARDAEKCIADKTRALEPDKLEQTDAFAAREPPQQRQASGVEDCPLHGQPGLSVMPWSWRRSQGDDGRDNGVRSPSTRGARKQHQCWAAPCQRGRLPAPKEGLVGIRLHASNRTIFGDDLHR